MTLLRKKGELEIAGGPAYLSELTKKVASSANIEYHARIIAQKYIQSVCLDIDRLIDIESIFLLRLFYILDQI